MTVGTEMRQDYGFPAALVFDMDGVLVDSNPFHLKKWAEFLDERGVRYTRKELMNNVLGHHNNHAIRHFFGDTFSAEEIVRLDQEIEARFRQAFRGHAKPLAGITSLIAECQAARIPMGVATSAMRANVDFVLDALDFRPHFRCVLCADQVSHQKPHPEIYARAAAMLGFEPSVCIAFEDSTPGIESAKSAGMKAVAIASTFPAEDLRRHGQADLVVASFEELNLERLRQLSTQRTQGVSPQRTRREQS